MIKGNGLLGIVGMGVVLTAMGVGLVNSCLDNHYKSKPGIVYMVNGTPVIERRFNTNKEFQDYLNSEQGKREAEFYSAHKK